MIVCYAENLMMVIKGIRISYKVKHSSCCLSSLKAAKVLKALKSLDAS